MNFVRRRQMKMRIPQAPIEAWRSPKSFSESARKRLQRTIVGVQGNVCNRHSGMPQLIRCSLQQQPPPHGCRSFFDRAPKQPVKLRAALTRPARHILRLRLTVQRGRNNCREALCRLLTIRFTYAPGFHLERIIDKPHRPSLDRAYQSSTSRGRKNIFPLLSISTPPLRLPGTTGKEA